MIRRCCTPLLVLALSAPAWAQGFDSGSDGSDGVLTFPAGAGVIDFDPQALGIDADGDNVFHLVSVDVPAGTTVRLRASKLGGQGRPVVWLVQGAVSIAGTLDLSGDNGTSINFAVSAAEPGAGGFAGGVGETTQTAPSGGAGPGGGGSLAAGASGGAGPAGHLEVGAGTLGGSAYGNRFQLPLLGGSGGGGSVRGPFTTGGGGGAGGGAILIASSTLIDVSGSIDASGGARQGGTVAALAGSGSGGAIRLVAPTLQGSGTLTVAGGETSASPGRLRLEAFNDDFAGTRTPISALTSSSPGLLFPPADAPRVQVTAVDGVAVAASPTASFVTPDVVIDSDVPVTITIAAQNVPVGTQVTLRMVSEDGGSITVLSDPLAGTVANSTASAGPITVPPGFSRFFVTASFTPQ